MPDYGSQVRPQATPSLELPEHCVVVLDELALDVLRKVLRLLTPEPGLPAGMGDNLLNELQVPEEELLGSEVAGGGGEGSHRSEVILKHAFY